MPPAAAERTIRAELERIGLLLLQDSKLPSLAAIVAGRPIKGSWWGDPAGGEIFRIASALDDDGDVMTAKLIAGKVTFVHRRLFAALIAVGAERAPWQLAGLPGSAATLLARVVDEGAVRASGPPAKELERRLLCASRQVHTERGAHVTELVGWRDFARAIKARGAPSPERAKAELEAAAERLGPGARLPW